MSTLKGFRPKKAKPKLKESSRICPKCFSSKEVKVTGTQISNVQVIWWLHCNSCDYTWALGKPR